jgi:biotin carboxyl carrier protein
MAGCVEACVKAIEVEVEGRLVRGYAQEIGGALWLHARGETFLVEAPKQESRSRGRTAVDPGRILSPMPGKIVKIHAKVGDRVLAGGALVTLEAMKMEYALKAQAEGVVRELGCAPGDQVALGQTLVILDLKLDIKGEG